jgi:hypothetical protein
MNLFLFSFLFVVAETLIIGNDCDVKNIDADHHRHSTGIRHLSKSSDRQQSRKLARDLQTTTADSSSFSTQIAQLTASNAKEFSFFGNSNQLAIDNNRIIVGANGFETKTGAAYLFIADPHALGQFTETAIMMASDATETDEFGDSVDIHGDWIAIGAWAKSNQTGAVYIYQILDNGNAVTEQAKIIIDNGEPGDAFGWSVAIYENLLLVGARGVDDKVGSAYLFSDNSTNRKGHEWIQLLQWRPNNETILHMPGDSFGWSVALHQNIAVIGTDGGDAAYVHQKKNENDELSWTFMAKLVGPPESMFGLSVDVVDDWIVVGAFETNDGENGREGVGAAFVFFREGVSWTQVAQLMASDGGVGEHFGRSVAMSEGASVIVVGAFHNDVKGENAGASYLFQHAVVGGTLDGWTEAGTFVATDGTLNDELGRSIAISNNIIVMGAPYDDADDGGENAGSVYVVDISKPGVAPNISNPDPTSNASAITNFPSSVLLPAPINIPSSENGVATSNPTEKSRENNSNKLAVIGIITGGGVLVVIAAMVVLGICLLNKKRALQQQQQLPVDIIANDRRIVIPNALYVAPTPPPLRDSTIEVIGVFIENHEETANNKELGQDFKDQAGTIDPDARKKNVTRQQHVVDDPPATILPFPRFHDPSKERLNI